MKIQLEWLKEYVDIDDVSVEEVGHLLTMAGLEIEAQETAELSGGKMTEVLELNITPNRSRIGDVKFPSLVVAPTNVNGFKSNFTLRAFGPESNIISIV